MAFVKLASCCIATVLLLVMPARMQAQTVRGRVLTADGAAATGATVLLLDTARIPRGGAFVGADGTFSITTSSAGRYVLEVQRIGLHTTQSAWFDLATGQTFVLALTVSLEAVELPEIKAIGKGRCGKRTDPRVAVVWDEARKALHAAALTNRANLYRYQIRRHFRVLSPSSLRVLRDSSVLQLSTHTGSPFASLAADTLILNGFIQEKAAGTFYNAPDADVLLSNTFAEAFCFNLKANRDQNLIGLTFEPLGRAVTSSIKGTLWLDRSNSELRFIDYDYVGSAVPSVAKGLIGGRIDFRRLTSGPWIVDKWYIRMPLYVDRSFSRFRGNQFRRIVLSELTEEGAEVLSVLSENSQAVSALRETRKREIAVSIPAAPAYALPPLEVVVRTPERSTRLTRGTRVDLLTREDIAKLETRAFHVGDLVKPFPSLRVRELRHVGGVMKGLCIESARSQMEIRGSACNSVMVVVDGAPYNPAHQHVVQMLLDLSPNMLESVEYLSSAEAGPLYGTGSKHGALVLYTRGNGPYAKKR